jgi:hypothetical protein
LWGAPIRAQASIHDDLGDHRQVDPDDVAGLHAARLQRVGEALDVAMQLGVGDVALLALLPAPVERHAVAVAGLHVAIQAVVRRVDPATGEPLVERGVGTVEHGVPLAEPVQRPRLLGPPRRRIPRRRLVRRSVADQRLGGELLGRVEALDVEERREALLERLLSGGHGGSPPEVVRFSGRAA